MDLNTDPNTDERETLMSRFRLEPLASAIAKAPLEIALITRHAQEVIDRLYAEMPAGLHSSPYYHNDPIHWDNCFRLAEKATSRVLERAIRQFGANNPRATADHTVLAVVHLHDTPIWLGKRSLIEQIRSELATLTTDILYRVTRLLRAESSTRVREATRRMIRPLYFQPEYDPITELDGPWHQPLEHAQAREVEISWAIEQEERRLREQYATELAPTVMRLIEIAVDEEFTPRQFDSFLRT